MYLCFICQSPYGTINGLKSHLLYGNHTLGITSHYKCCQLNCFKEFYSLSKFIIHLERVHPNDVGVPENYVEAVENNDLVINENFINENELVVEEPLLENVNEGNNILNDPISLESFIKAVCKNSELISAQLSAIPNINRKNVTTVINAMSDFFGCGIVETLKNNVLQLFANCQCNDPAFADKIYQITTMFEILENPFESVATEYKRLLSLEKEGFYIPPEPQLYGHHDDYEAEGNIVELVRAPSYGLVVPLRKSLKAFLELPGMFDMIMDYVNSLNNEISCKNFVQGELWQGIAANYFDRTVLPVHLHFDDFEPDNVLGSHATSNSLGAVYATIPALPPQFKSSVENMFLVSLFLTSHRSMFGNNSIFTPVVDELIFLEENGIDLHLNRGNRTVYFCLGLIVGDNKGNHSIQGLVESFTANYYCRLCKMHKLQARHACVSDNTLIRNPLNYDEDVALGNPAVTGIKENCVFNRVPSYHVTKNITCDIMHDIFEGMLNYGLCAILKDFLVDREYFSLDVLIDRIEGFSYGPSEFGNRPPTSFITIDRIINNNVNLSASEMLCLSRYLGEMICDLVPCHCDTWRYYLVLREIIEIVTCSFASYGTDMHLKSLVESHHELYIQISGSHLKPKHHFMIHYPDILRSNGPFIDFCALTSERKHRMGKLYAHSSNSRVHLPLSISIKLQLQFAQQLLKLSCNSQPVFKSLSAVKSLIASTLDLYQYFRNAVTFNGNDIVQTVKSVDICGTMYQTGMVVVIGCDLCPVFATICHIIVTRENPKFVLKLKNTLCYRSHTCAYVVDDTMDFLYISQDNFFSHVPLWQRTAITDGAQLVSLRTSL